MPWGRIAEQTLAYLSRPGRARRDITKALKDPKYYDYQPVPVAFDVPQNIDLYIGEHKMQFRGVDVENVPVRTYPEGDLAAHVLGYTGQITPPQLDSPCPSRATTRPIR